MTPFALVSGFGGALVTSQRLGGFGVEPVPTPAPPLRGGETGATVSARPIAAGGEYITARLGEVGAALHSSLGAQAPWR